MNSSGRTYSSPLALVAHPAEPASRAPTPAPLPPGEVMPHERTFERQFNTDCVKPPTDQYRLGTSTNDEYLGPGYMNWDISVFKNVPMGGTRRLQLRVELYNAFNTDQWTGVNTNASFDYTTGALTNANTFGRLNGNTNSARRIQLGARFTF